MPYVALEWDHKIGKPMIYWLVVQCSGVGEKCGGPQALPPRRDIAYFVSEETAERDAKVFAAYKNSLHEVRGSTPDGSAPLESGRLRELRRHAFFAWDHNIFHPVIRWAVLEWGGEGGNPIPRQDIAYFLDPETAESDAKAFSALRDDWIEHSGE